MRASASPGRLIMVSNRLPFLLSQDEGGAWTLLPGAGGLVSALEPVLRNRGGLWVGWPGTTREVPHLRQLLRNATRDQGYGFRPVILSQREFEDYYQGYANESLWPLFHDLQSHCAFKPEYWHAYRDVNRRFAEVVADSASPADFIWVHDYQLGYVGQALRELGLGNRLGFFLHIPFPPPDIFLKLPERNAFLKALLVFDLLGFQTQRDRRNFVQCVRTLVKNARVRAMGSLHTVQVDDREVNVAAFPIGIDFRSFARRAAASGVADLTRRVRGELAGRQIILGIDRLDYTKGIPQRLEAFRRLLMQHPDVQGRVNLIQVVVPSRRGMLKYEQLKEEIDRLVGEINGQFTRSGWVPVHYIYRSLSPEELLAYYRASDIALVTPLKDGMNLVAKEFCACSVGNDSVLVLSQFAGAAAQLGRHALVVNPYDVEQTAAAIYQAFVMPPEERRVRMRSLRRSVRAQDIFWWVDSFMRAAINKELRDFPILEDYIPERDGPDEVGSSGEPRAH